jgi:hypothetical protein
MEARNRQKLLLVKQASNFSKHCPMDSGAADDERQVQAKKICQICQPRRGGKLLKSKEKVDVSMTGYRFISERG